MDNYEQKNHFKQLNHDLKNILTLKKSFIFARVYMVVVAQLVRAPDCGSGGRRFEPGLPPTKKLGITEM